MTFNECLIVCAGQKELVSEFDRLAGTSLGENKSPINQMIDEATGKERADIVKFIEFVYDCVWLRLEPCK